MTVADAENLRAGSVSAWSTRAGRVGRGSHLHVLLVLCWFSTTLAAESKLFTVDAPPRPAQLESAENQAVRVVEGGKLVTIADAKIVSWGVPLEADRPQMVLADGGILVAEISAIDAEQASVVSPTFGGLKLPLAELATCLLHPPTDPWRRDALRERMLSANGDLDRLLLANGDELRGTIVSSDGNDVAFRTAIGGANADAIHVPLANVAAIVFNPALRARAKTLPTRTWIGLSDGSLLLTADWSLIDGKLQLASSSATAWTSNEAAASEPLAFLQPLSGEARYLSDLEPEAYRHIPYLGREWPYRLDRTVSGAQLRAGGRLFVKGVGMHSASRLTFPLGAGYAKFEAEIAIDDEALGGGSVVFRVFADAEERYRSPVIHGGDAPTPISVPVAGATRLSLVVDHAERGDQLDRADWLNARLLK